MLLSELINDLRDKKVSQAPLHQHLISINHEWATKLVDCGSWLHLREWLEHDCKTTVQNANFCKNHFMCRACAVRRASKATAKYLERIEACMAEDPSLVPAIMTTTIKNGESLVDSFLHLKSSRQRLSKMARNQRSRKNRPAEMLEVCKIAGGVYNMEIKRGKSGLWHPHYHDLVLLSDYIDQAKLSAEWEAITGDSKIVGITRINTESEKGLFGGVLEVLKYSTKFSELDPVDVVEIFSVMKGERFLNSYGCLRGVQLGDLDCDEPLSGLFRDYIAWYLHAQRRYLVKDYSENVHPSELDDHGIYRQH